MSIKQISTALVALALVFAINSMSIADSHKAAEPVVHKLVIQVSTDDEKTQTIALNNAVNLQKHYGVDNVEIEIVAYGPGLGMLTTESESRDRISSLAQQDITFTACGNTMENVEKKTGKAPTLIEGVTTTPTGVARIMELQEQGYSYIRP